MLLGNYFDNINSKYKKFFFSGISLNSNKVVKDNIFFAIKGNKLNGENFILHAIKNGSKIIITERENEGLKDDILYIKIKNIIGFSSLLTSTSSTVDLVLAVIFFITLENTQ